ncbi:hypothetical protein [Gracilibacillus sp. YIM 98692]|uniref:hypothetical protein n=1 Tax=Gracilibacillus sp. YIM 98692 TaxID=2663532 RepID=UPI0013D67A88|nr:hypothetical protein [Gracilibacillus sp. YIM 98692]
MNKPEQFVSKKTIQLSLDQLIEKVETIESLWEEHQIQQCSSNYLINPSEYLEAF